MSRTPRTIKSVQNTVEMIDTLKDRKEATPTEIADQVGLSKGTVHTYLTTLRREGYVDKTPEGKYSLSLEFIHLGSHLREQLEIYNYGKNEADKLAQRTDDVIHLAVESGGIVRVLYSTRGNPLSFKGATPTGGTLPMHASATGKALLAKLPEERVRDVIDEHGLSPLTTHTITEPEALFEELETIREQGYANNAEEQTVGAQTLATDVQRPNGELAGAIAISGTVSRFENKGKEELIGNLCQTANQIEINIQRGTDIEYG